MTANKIQLWPIEKLGEGIIQLSKCSGLLTDFTDKPSVPHGNLWSDENGDYAEKWVGAFTGRIGLETIPVEIDFSNLYRMFTQKAPLILSFRQHGALMILSCNTRYIKIINPQNEIKKIPIKTIENLIMEYVPENVLNEIRHTEKILELGTSRKRKLENFLLSQLIGNCEFALVWELRLPPNTSFHQQLKRAGLYRLIASYIAVYIPKMMFWLSGWWVLWQGVSNGELIWGWMILWLLVTFSNIPFKLAELWYSALISTALGWLLKRRLLTGIMKLPISWVRLKGAGQLFSRSIESEQAESLTMVAGIICLNTIIDLLLAIPILYLGIGGGLHTFILVLWLLLTSIIMIHVYQLRKKWLLLRLNSTHDLVEKMMGHKTRISQEEPNNKLQAEDIKLAEYHKHCQKMDWWIALMNAIVPGGWLILSMIIITLSVSQNSINMTSLVIAFGGSLYVLKVLDMLSYGLVEIVDSILSWKKIMPIFKAGANKDASGLAEFSVSNHDDKNLGIDKADKALELDSLMFKHKSRHQPVLKGASLKINYGDHVLIQGSSGSGKSTLISIALGHMQQDSGLVLLDGLDYKTLGSHGWRNRIVSAPQFHENHVFLESFAFNALMGRSWPPKTGDIQKLTEICYELGLQPLIDRMPGGLLQMVGETGWQLSHGERSRLFIARALMQNRGIVCFDESFTALDPQNLEKAISCVLKNSQTTIVVAHP